jgi:hypothetical protein
LMKKQSTVYKSILKISAFDYRKIITVVNPK